MGTTIAVVVVEWLLFELVRMPYRPPDDMSTLLGQEKYGVYGLMGVIATVWLLYVLWDGLQPLPTAREVVGFLVLFSTLAAVIMAVVLHPPWPVTPFDLLFQ